MAAIIREPGKPWEITELELDEPKAGEVRIAFRASGMCHSDEHLQTGDSTGRLPMVGGHEGAYQDLDDGKLIRGVILHA
jgi:S-(hydroxymethyl)glutathione dehydrogenase/alcohol dehydrogenase